MAKRPTAQAVFPACSPLTLFTRIAATITLSVAALTLAPVAASAHETVIRVNANTTTQAPVYTAKANLNLLRRTTSDNRSSKRRTSSVGRGSYICSPAGFGQRSRCYSN
ncbi:hypothetical protein KMP13_08455 [Epibacterium ulvae]|uniref:hypothetical protein n=1 Tax=Epibacterium ulvae TaxID=1156985 RepID=UPI001BFCA1EB|nr:hypothetical protein [Epibacterium ulvae]MBT8153926.1 hypothetical protein [Epibacterium ulvae]